MPSKKRLNPEEREFFSLVNQAVLANPFSDERVEVDLKIAGMFPGVSREELLEKTIDEVRKRLSHLEKDGRGRLDSFTEKDRKTMMVSFMFEFFHFFVKKFDALINEQMTSGETTVKIDFARDAFSFLDRRGFTHDEILHFFALCYQLRRAFYLIDRQLIGRSACMKKLRESLWNNIFTYDLDLYNQYLWNRMEDFSTLILGETGTGKGAAASAIGCSGFIPFDEKKQSFTESFTSSFISLNLSQFSENLIESELFGHKKGAFTGAVDDHKGIFDKCSPCGAIFLDEIGEVAVPVQIKLLKVLEERTYAPVGSHSENRFEGRIIAATNRPIEEIRGKSLFRDDFFYRLCSDIIHVPPLWQRIKEDPEELNDLLDHTVERITGNRSAGLVEMVRKAVLQQVGKTYIWPGNVRELAQCVRRILLNRSYKSIMISSSHGTGSQLSDKMEKGDIDAQNLIKGYCRLLYDRFGTYGEVARRTKLDRRTVKKYIES